MLVLGIDTSAEACAVAVVADGAVLARAGREMTHGHAEALMPIVAEAMAAAGRALGDVGLVAVTVGPGSFTGVRTGIAAARGIALGAGARAVGVSSLAAVAAGALADAPGGEAVCVLETRRRDYYVQAFRAAPGTPDAGPAALSEALVTDAAGVLRLLRDRPRACLAGNAVARFAAEIGGLPEGVRAAPGPGRPDPALVAALGVAAEDRAAAGAAEKGLEDTLSPLYLRAPEAKLPEAGGRLRR
jgi:tRNA threonylcarbamoyladenosine biosynthesis protein TsaB